MIEQLSRVFSRRTFEDILQNPKENPQALILMIGILVLLIFILLVLLGIFYIKPAKKKQLPEQLPMQLGKVLLFIQFTGIIFVLLWSTASYLTSTDSFCVRCHQEKPFASSLERTVHRDASCLSCHQGVGLSGWLREKMSVNERFMSWLRGGKIKGGTGVESWACLRCHKQVLRKPREARHIGVSHKEIQKAGYRCIDCHSDTAHPGQIGRSLRPSMYTCITCHNKKPLADCSVCHVDDVGFRRSGTNRLDFPATIINNPKCSGCHKDFETCDKCHPRRKFP